MTYDRAAIMRDAHRRYRDGVRLNLGWSFAQCLRTAWIAAKLRKEFPPKKYNPLKEWSTYYGGLVAHLEIIGASA
jgi:hypothetical protein